MISVKDVPVPGLGDKFVLVRNSASVIGAGVEKTSIDMARKNLLQKAKARPYLVKQALKKLRTVGFRKTFQTVGARLDSPSPLGYSSAGTVLAVGGLVEGIKRGDRVACGGVGYANHAEVVAVPRNLVVKIPDSVSDEEAAFTTLGSIGLQGIRLAEPKLSEAFLVLGLGILGQRRVQILRANGCRVLGTDLDATQVELAGEHGAIGLDPDSDTARSCLDLTSGRRVDGVLVCAGTSGNQPIELCGQVTREKGRVVVVGAVRMDIPREDYFRKEISVVISGSYGPGRYDPFYEESGNDCPFGYVRFTEQRNMESILGLIDQGGLTLKNLVTHRFDVDDAADTYKLIHGKKTEPYTGIVLNYNPSGDDDRRLNPIISINTKPIDTATVGVSFFGAGNYATASLLPPLQQNTSIELRGLVTASGSVANIVYTADGSPALSKEYVEIHGGGRSAIIRDFQEASFYTADMKTSTEKLGGQDKGRQNIAQVLVDWANTHQITLMYIQPGKPTQNAYVERYNRTVRHEWFDLHMFESVEQAQLLSTP